jgi:catechol 2,3-dioxygenase-like lactoylglutathione lyase family enzyme
MVCDLAALTFASPDPDRLAAFWGGVLEERVTTVRGAPGLATPDGVGFALRYVASAEPKRGPNQMHPDLKSRSLAEQDAAVERALALGARHLDVGQGPDAEHVVLADPDGNELCVLEPGGSFLAGCPFFSSLAGDGLAEVGRFWRDALGWALVWDVDGETAVQHPDGGPKLTWGGEPVAPKHGVNRLHLDVVPRSPSTVPDEVDRLLSLGATPAPAVCPDGVGLADPGGNELCVVRLD